MRPPVLLGPGDHRQITAKGVDGERIYQANVDAQGRLTEVYTFNGDKRPGDAFGDKFGGRGHGAPVAAFTTRSSREGTSCSTISSGVPCTGKSSRLKN